MPRTRGVRVAPPVDVPAVKPAKLPPVSRSASLVSLPTPPRTVTKRKRSRSRATDSDSEDEEAVARVSSSDEEHAGGGEKDGASGRARKKRKTLDDIAEELSAAQMEEEAFWMGTLPSTASKKQGAKGGERSTASKKQGAKGGERSTARAQYRLRSRSRTRSPSSSPPPAPHLLRREHTGLVSPPPSRRQPRIQPRPATPPPPPRRSTRITRSIKPALFPTRDSPNNPFLVDTTLASMPESEAASLPEPRTPGQHVEGPTLSYVFRGAKIQFDNPYYKSPGSSKALEDAEARSRLPLEHPDFSPPPSCAPRLLFPEARRLDHARRRPRPVPEVPRASQTGS
ncbi:hypothetical protein AcV5_003805 [Taiwanofungus camphoratus]|nr:hypothetical protein AcV5_003805 [Antrodia cinnamomea]